MNKHIGMMLLLWIVVVFSTSALGATNIYVGGIADGHSGLAAFVNVGYPVVNNADGATNVTETTACLNGYLVSTGMADTTVFVYWDTTDKGTNTTWTNERDLGLQQEGTFLTTNVTGLSTGVTYYYRFYASNALDHAAWAPESAVFTTDAAPSLNTGSGAGPVSFTTATLTGSLITGNSADIYVYWGQDTNDWSNTNSLGVLSQGAFWAQATGLGDGSNYYYRSYATNDSGEYWSDIVSFNTFSLLDGTPLFSGGAADGFDALNALLMMQAPLGTVITIR